MTGRLRLFGLLALLVPLFAGLQLVVGDAVPQVEVRVVPQEVTPAAPAMVPVEVPVERVVERVVFVPVDRSNVMPAADGPEPGLVTGGAADAATSDPTDGPIEAAAVVPAEPDNEAPAAEVADQEDDEPGLTGVVSVAPPPPAPAAASLPVPVAALASGPAEPVPADEPVAVEEAPTEATADQEVAEAPEDSEASAEPEVEVIIIAESAISTEADGAMVSTTRMVPVTVPVDDAPESDVQADEPADDPAAVADEDAAAAGAAEADPPAAPAGEVVAEGGHGGPSDGEAADDALQADALVAGPDVEVNAAGGVGERQAHEARGAGFADPDTAAHAHDVVVEVDVQP